MTTVAVFMVTHKLAKSDPCRVPTAPLPKHTASTSAAVRYGCDDVNALRHERVTEEDGEERAAKPREQQTTNQHNPKAKPAARKNEGSRNDRQPRPKQRAGGNINY